MFLSTTCSPALFHLGCCITDIMHYQPSKPQLEPLFSANSYRSPSGSRPNISRKSSAPGTTRRLSSRSALAKNGRPLLQDQVTETGKRRQEVKQRRRRRSGTLSRGRAWRPRRVRRMGRERRTRRCRASLGACLTVCSSVCIAVVSFPILWRLSAAHCDFARAIRTARRALGKLRPAISLSAFLTLYCDISSYARLSDLLPTCCVSRLRILLAHSLSHPSHRFAKGCSLLIVIQQQHQSPYRYWQH